MSCRVLKRELELAMFDALATEAAASGVRVLVGTFAPTPKNAMVATLYRDLGFELVREEENGTTVWRLELEPPPAPKNWHIRRAEWKTS
jgi:predicted enzyme involved in methoxymalonyl-ACP biosynthesis